MSKFYCNITSFGYFSGIVYCLLRIREQCPHLVLGLEVILSALVTHSVLVLHLFLCLDTEQDVMCLCVLRKCIMYVICAYELYPGFLRKTKYTCICFFLFGYTMILQFKEIVSLAKYFKMPLNCCLCSLIVIPE